VHPEVNEKLLVLVEELLPGVPLDGALGARGQFHDVVLLPGRAAIRIARGLAAEQELERRTELSRRLAGLGLPFAVPEPLTPVKVLHGRTAVAMSWIEGDLRAKAAGEPAVIAGLLRALAEVDCTPLRDVLGEPHEYAGRADWARVTGLDADGTPITLEGTGLFARMLQHETGHLDGFLYLDRLVGRHARSAKRAVKSHGWGVPGLTWMPGEDPDPFGH